MTMRALILSTALASVALSGCTTTGAGIVNTLKATNSYGADVSSAGLGSKDAIDAEIAALDPIFLGGEDDLVKGPPPPSFKKFKHQVKRGTYVPPEIAKARYDALRSAATSFAAQAGYYRRCYEIMQILEKQSPKLSEVFNFNRVAYGTQVEAGFLLPPIVSRAVAAISVNDMKTEIVAADEFYRIEVPGRLVPVLPTWRDYLVLALEAPNDPEPSFLPKGREERVVWDHYLAVGWQAGVNQAESALQASMNLLRRDYLGMIEYRRAVQAGVIDELVVTFDEKRSAGELNELFIGERRVKIVDGAKFQRNAHKWKPIQRRL